MALYPPSFQRYIGYRDLISFYRKESTLPKTRGLALPILPARTGKKDMRR